MLKSLFFLTAVAVAVLVVTGVIEVKLHTDQLASVPSRLLTVVQDQQLLEQARVQVVRLKRAAEQQLTDSEQRKLELALIYAQNDATRLEKLIEENQNDPTKLLPQAQLLADSISRVQNQAEQAPEQTLANLKESSEETFRQARGILITLKGLEAQYEEVKNKLSEVTTALQDNIGESGEVAGSKDTPAESTIPLQF